MTPREERVERAKIAIAYLEANPDDYETILVLAKLEQGLRPDQRGKP